MTKREAAIVAAYTGVMIGEFSDLHAYIEEKLGRSVPIHRLPALADTIAHAAYADFIAIEVTTDETK